MNCEEATKLMDGYLNGELDPITSQSIEQHLPDCPSCHHAFEPRRAHHFSDLGMSELTIVIR